MQIKKNRIERFFCENLVIRGRIFEISGNLGGNYKKTYRNRHTDRIMQER